MQLILWELLDKKQDNLIFFRKYLRSALSYKVWSRSTLKLNLRPSRAMKEFCLKSFRN